MRIISKLNLAIVCATLVEPAFAGRPIEVSEPGTLTLLGLAGVVASVVAIRRRRK